MVIMKIYLVSNNLLLDNISYDNSANLDTIRLTRPLSIKGSNLAKELSNKDIFNNIEKIYSSYHASAISSSKYLADKLNIDIILKENLNDCKVGYLGSKNMKMVKGLQDHEFTYKLSNGESLNEVGDRLNLFLYSIYKENCNMVLFTHKRAILGLLLKYSTVGYNLDDNLILEYNNNLIYDDTESNIDIYELTIHDNKIKDIKKVDYD